MYRSILINNIIVFGSLNTHADCEKSIVKKHAIVGKRKSNFV